MSTSDPNRDERHSDAETSAGRAQAQGSSDQGTASQPSKLTLDAAADTAKNTASSKSRKPDSAEQSSDELEHVLERSTMEELGDASQKAAQSETEDPQALEKSTMDAAIALTAQRQPDKTPPPPRAEPKKSKKAKSQRTPSKTSRR